MKYYYITNTLYNKNNRRHTFMLNNVLTKEQLQNPLDMVLSVTHGFIEYMVMYTSRLMPLLAGC